MSKAQPNNAAVVNDTTRRLHALKAYVDNKALIPIDGEPHKLTELLALYQRSLETRALLATKRAEVKAAMVERASAEKKRRAADRALKPWVINTFGEQSKAAHDFGFPPSRAASRTAEEKMKAVEKALATRKARHTMGTVERLKIKGVIAAAVVAEPVEPMTTKSNGASAPAVNGVSPH